MEGLGLGACPGAKTVGINPWPDLVWQTKSSGKELVWGDFQRGKVASLPVAA